MTVAAVTKIRKAAWPEPPTIHKTTDYARFGLGNANRPLDKANLSKLQSLNKEGKFYPHKNPILVDANYQIKDGQHRFQICFENNIPVYYIQDTDQITPEEVMDLNRAGKSHSVSDRLQVLKDSKTELGAHVRKALAFWETHGKPRGLTQTLICQLL